jgi:signal transduction histidine kinase
MNNYLPHISHEIKNSLNGIRGYLDMLHKNDFGKLNPDQKKIIKKIINKTIEIEKFSENILHSSIIQNKTLKKNKTNLCTLLTEFYQDNQNKINPSIKFTLSLPQEKIYTKLNKHQFLICLNNLLHNSIKHTQKGNIKITLKNNKKNITLSITDTGSGISSKDLPNIFNKFHKNKNSTGFGLGLFITKEIINLHGWQIKAASRGHNKGSKFQIIIPKS